MPKDNRLDYNEVLLSDKDSDNPLHARIYFTSQVEKALILKGKVIEQQDKIASEVVGVAPHNLAFSLHPSNLAGKLQLPNMEDAKAARKQQHATEDILDTLLKQTDEAFKISETLKLPLTPKNAESVLKGVITYKETELKQIKEEFMPIEAEYEKNKKEYYFFPSLRAPKPEKYEHFATRIEKITKDINELTMTHDKIYKAKEAITEWDSLAQYHEAHAPFLDISSSATTPSGSSEEHAQAILQIMKQVDYS